MSFLHLPTELRFHIYSYISIPDAAPFSAYRGLFLSCKQIALELIQEAPKTILTHITKTLSQTPNMSVSHAPCRRAPSSRARQTIAQGNPRAKSFGLHDIRITLDATTTPGFHIVPHPQVWTHLVPMAHASAQPDALAPVLGLHLTSLVIQFSAPATMEEAQTMKDYLWCLDQNLSALLKTEPMINTQRIVLDLPAMMLRSNLVLLSSPPAPLRCGAGWQSRGGMSRENLPERVVYERDGFGHRRG